MLKNIIQKLLIVSLVGLYSAGAAYASISQTPLFLVTSVNPNVLFNMSVEVPMGGAAYNDQPNADTGCTGRVNDGGTVGVCYFPSEEYLGYFDPDKCYNYNGTDGIFESDGAVNNTDHECTGKFSGNFMNWASMTAMDMFVWTMTGGNRITDTTSETIIRRTRKQNNDGWFPHKLIKSSHNVSASTVTPWSDPVYIDNTSFGIKFGSSRDDDDLSSGEYNLQLKVCEVGSLEDNCVAYGSGSYYKPEGLIQQNADDMRFGVTSYTNSNDRKTDGGVLRSNMKYVGTTMPDGSGGTITNPLAEIYTDGIINTNANPTDATASGVSQSGVITYLNKFSDYGYKGYDPASELFYESIRYFKNLGPTAEYLVKPNGASWNNGGFPMLDGALWEDPIQYSCQKNFLIGMNDAYTWRDKRLPGTFFTSSTSNGTAVSDNDYGEPSTPDTDIDVTALTNTVGWLQGFSTSYRLGEKMFTGRQNSHYIAGLAYYANTQDIRTGTAGNLGATTNFSGKQTITTFMIDSQEYSSNPSTGEDNMLWLAGKYGGFTDVNDDDDPNTTITGGESEWDADGDGEPDNYVLATEPEKLVAALSQVFTSIKSITSSSASAATNSTRLDTNSMVYQARFDSTSWTGQLLAYSINSDGSIGSLTWDAANFIPTEDDRKIFSYDPDASATKGIIFEYDNLHDDQKLLLNQDAYGTTDSLGSTRVNHIRGDTSTEVQNGGAFRNRDSLMGDIVNSDPWFLGTLDNFGYSELEDSDEASAYTAFRDTKLARTAALFFAANDGMLHAINASTGAELFTYIPNEVIGSLSTLSSTDYACDGCSIAHRYFVDGAPRAGDAYFGGDWHSVLIGTLGAGGKGLFALDVSDPSSFTAADVLWEISSTQAPDPDGNSDLTDFSANLGYTLPQASIVKLHGNNANHRWAAVVANGYESTNGSAVLYLIDIEDGSIIKRFDTETSSNGLSTPIAVDEDGDRITDVIYAGDLLGNLWKFDVSNSNSGHWEIAFSSGHGVNATPEPLFKAVDSANVGQPITAKPQVGVHPDGGLMVYFGSGKYFESNDQIVGASPQVQTFYGIRDQGSQVTARSDLQEQEILAEETLEVTADNVLQTPSNPLPVDSSLIDVRVTSDTTVVYDAVDSALIKNGWFMNLESPENGAEGERLVSAPLLRAGRIIFSTLIPDPDACNWGGSSWLMELDAVNGSRLDTTPFDINNDGVFNADDYVLIYDTDGDGDVDSDDAYLPVSGFRKPDLGIIKTPGVITCANGAECKYTSGSSGNLDMVLESSDSPTGRQSWRQLR
ncbi:MAG: PilC/PilY family type IV pilus protein [Cycloclasticus sp.]